ADDPKYRTKCFDAHVTTLSRVLIILTLICYILLSYALNPIGIAGLIITFLGIGAIFQELRTPLRIYIKLNVLHFVASLSATIARNARDPWYDYTPSSHSDSGMTIAIGYVGLLVALLLEIPMIITYWSLLHFIDDREAAERTPILSNVRVEGTTTAASAPTVPSAPPFECYAPPPYEEKGSA
ncbi:hypothetical protein PMAYCL1PPCAC_22947, partial [Pristionchus mayeri]